MEFNGRSISTAKVFVMNDDGDIKRNIIYIERVRYFSNQNNENIIY